MLKHMLCLPLIISSFLSQAQTANDEVSNAVKDYVDAFYYGDTGKIHRSISINVVKYGYYIPKAKTIYEGEPMSFKEMIDYAAGVKKRGAGPNVEKFPKKIEVFDVQDQTASAKLTAWWGTDYILLAKLDGRWMITHVLWQSPPPKKN
ncbi:MAG: nuclear transport factor 2 family protein [Chitinophagaceae bacterium]